MPVGRQRSDEYDMGKLEAQVGMMSARLDRMEDDMRRIFNKLDEIATNQSDLRSLLSQYNVRVDSVVNQCSQCPEKWDEVNDELRCIRTAASSDVINLKVRETMEDSRLSPALEKRKSQTSSVFKRDVSLKEILMDGTTQAAKMLVVAGILGGIYLAITWLKGMP